MESIEKRLARLEADSEQLKKIQVKQGETLDDHEETLDAHAEEIKKASTAATGAISSLGKPKEKERPGVCDKTAEVSYNENFGQAGKAASMKKGTFKLKNPMVHFNGATLPAFEAIDNKELMTYYVENTWLNAKHKSLYVIEVS